MIFSISNILIFSFTFLSIFILLMLLYFILLFDSIFGFFGIVLCFVAQALLSLNRLTIVLLLIQLFMVVLLEVFLMFICWEWLQSWDPPLSPSH